MSVSTPQVSEAPVLVLEDLRVSFRTDEGDAEAVRGVSLSLGPGESLAIVGESGSGKTVTALSLLDLVPRPVGRTTWEALRLHGEPLPGPGDRGWEGLRGRRIAMVFQDPMTSLNPVMTVGDQIAEVLVRHMDLSRKAALEEARNLLAQVRIPEPARRLADHPHEFSGGQRQRIMIAMALAGAPDVLIADEPTTALDVTVQAQIVGLIRDLQRASGMSILWITHDLGLVAGLADRVAVMYAGRVVEEARATDLFRSPAHPYTALLLRSAPRLDGALERLAAIDGQPPSLLSLPSGCAFADRCPLAEARCREADPELREVGSAHLAACWRSDEVARMGGGR